MLAFLRNTSCLQTSIALKAPKENIIGLRRMNASHTSCGKHIDSDKSNPSKKVRSQVTAFFQANAIRDFWYSKYFDLNSLDSIQINFDMNTFELG